jgi:hypothetical protein
MRVAKDGKGKKAKGDKAGAKKLKVPKEVSGVKVPKKLRKLGDQAVKLAKEPVVAEVVAGALLAAAAALREGKDPRGTAGAAFKGGMKMAAGGKNKAKGAAAAAVGGGRLSDSLKLIALDFARRALEPRDDGGEDGANAPRAADSAPAAKAPAPAEVPQAQEDSGLELPGGRGG